MKRGIYETDYGNAAYVSGPKAKTAMNVNLLLRALHAAARADSQFVPVYSAVTAHAQQIAEALAAYAAQRRRTP